MLLPRMLLLLVVVVLVLMMMLMLLLVRPVQLQFSLLLTADNRVGVCRFHPRKLGRDGATGIPGFSSHKAVVRTHTQLSAAISLRVRRPRRLLRIDPSSDICGVAPRLSLSLSRTHTHRPSVYSLSFDTCPYVCVNDNCGQQLFFTL